MRRFIIRQEDKLRFFDYIREANLPVPDYFKEPTWDSKAIWETRRFFRMEISKLHYCQVDMSDDDFLALKLKFNLEECIS